MTEDPLDAERLSIEDCPDRKKKPNSRTVLQQSGDAVIQYLIPFARQLNIRMVFIIVLALHMLRSSTFAHHPEATRRRP